MFLEQLRDCLVGVFNKCFDSLICFPPKICTTDTILCKPLPTQVALSKKIHVPLGPTEAKAKAFEVDLQFVKDVDIQEFFIEGDSHPPPHFLFVVSIIFGMQALCNEFCRVEFSHVRMQGN